MANIATLASVYHEGADAFVSCARAVTAGEEDAADGLDSGSDNSSAPVPEMVTSSAPVPSTAAAVVPAAGEGVTAALKPCT